MQYWKKPNNNIERFDDNLKEGKIKEMELKGHIRVMAKDDPTPYKAPAKKKSTKKSTKK
tara:strand:+ start:391 stop:567 length:177 start_codon:yes stop_codon:yes gene_type:complete